jgi:outer membrane protein assembly factor BamE (lipoprotein component of BamABCDE complex)
MLIRLNILAALLTLLPAYGCVSTGAREITDPARTARLESGKSTQAEVAALLGFPAIVTYSAEKQETWEYYYVTEYPTALDFVPVVNSLAGSNQTTRVLTVSYDRQGVVQNFQKSRLAGKAAVYPY